MCSRVVPTSTTINSTVDVKFWTLHLFLAPASETTCLAVRASQTATSLWYNVPNRGYRYIRHQRVWTLTEHAVGQGSVRSFS